MREMTKKFKGELEIDYERGVIYFTPDKTGWALLRICRLPKPIPKSMQLLDITYGHGVSWRDGEEVK